MAHTARERVARALGGDAPAGSFSAELLAPAEILDLRVAGVGQVGLPVRAPAARKLIVAARPAMFGRGTRTLTDTAVRDTWELTPDQFTVGGAGWSALLDQSLADLRDQLGLPAGSRLRAQPHALLIYGKGQFFLPHQDSEKADGMVGTLVVSLPSMHTGGELVIDHGGQRATYRSAPDQLSLVGFYADCRHQIMPVRSGYRVTLTFNLLADIEPADAVAEPEPDAALAHSLREHFATSATSRYGDRDLGPPNRLVFLLDHEYTQRSLSWRRLKGPDLDRAALLRAAAEQAGCETVLALAEVKEIWDVSSDDDGWGYDDDADGEDSDDPVVHADGYQLNDLIDDEITLDWWIGPEGTGEPISLRVSDHEVCAVTPSAQLTPYESEYEGYMGNYGNTLDRWYRRAAVVMWPRERAFTARAEAGSQWALEELGARITAGDLAGARAAAASLEPFWTHTATHPDLLGAALDVAARLDAAATAAMLLEPFRVTILTTEHGGALARSAGQYGQTWTRDLLQSWFGRGQHVGTDLSAWIEDTLPGLCPALRRAGAPEVAQLLNAGAWRWLAGRLEVWTATARAEIRVPQMESLGAPLVSLLRTAEDALRDEIADALRRYDDTVLDCLMPALGRGRAQQAPGLDALAHDCAHRLERILAQPPRAEDDWSIAWTGCGCDLCENLQAYLCSRSQRTLDWPLAAPGRRHIHTQIDSAALAVQHRTHRQGRPYTLVLTKTDELFTQAAEERRTAESDLSWLRSTWGT